MALSLGERQIRIVHGSGCGEEYRLTEDMALIIQRKDNRFINLCYVQFTTKSSEISWSIDGDSELDICTAITVESKDESEHYKQRVSIIRSYGFSTYLPNLGQ